MKRMHAALLVFILVSISSSLFAWNALGHMVVADIAYENLKPNARKQVDMLTNYFQREYPETESFLQVACWPDAIRAQKVETFTHWHYIDSPLAGDATKPKEAIDTDNAVWAFNHIQNVVKNKHANVYERMRFLAFLVHITADLHQPLHTVSYFSAKYPEGDRGGNLYYVYYNNQHIKMHKLWDQGVNVFTGEISIGHAHEVSNKIMALYPVKYFGESIDDLDAENWVKEGFANAKDHVYNAHENETLSQDYIDAGKKLAQQEAALAGYRLARLLNQLLG